MNHRRRNLDVRRAFPLVCAAPILLIVSYVIQYMQGSFKPGLLTFVPFIGLSPYNGVNSKIEMSHISNLYNVCCNTNT